MEKIDETGFKWLNGCMVKWLKGKWLNGNMIFALSIIAANKFLITVY
jgi:hypothetical protein